MEVYKCINAVQKAICATGISKDRKNNQGSGFVFRGIDDIYNVVSPIMADNGLCLLPKVIERVSVERQSKSGGALYYTTVKVEHHFVAAADGSSHVVITFGEAMDSSDKSTNKAMAAAYKYACILAFGIPTVGDNDADAHTHELNVVHLPQCKADKFEQLLQAWTDAVAAGKVTAKDIQAKARTKYNLSDAQIESINNIAIQT